VGDSRARQQAERGERKVFLWPQLVMADGVAEERKDTLSRKLSRRFSKKALEEEDKGPAPSSPMMMSSVGSAGAATGVPSMRRSSSMGGGPAGMPAAAEVERHFVALAKKMRLALLETRTVDLKWRMVAEWNAAQKAEPAETARLVRRVAKKPKPVGLLGVHAYLCEREAEWLIPFVKEGGGKQLLKVIECAH
jgi:hypothetical protein